MFTGIVEAFTRWQPPNVPDCDVGATWLAAREGFSEEGAGRMKADRWRGRSIGKSRR